MGLNKIWELFFPPYVWFNEISIMPIKIQNLSFGCTKNTKSTINRRFKSKKYLKIDIQVPQSRHHDTHTYLSKLNQNNVEIVWIYFDLYPVAEPFVVLNVFLGGSSDLSLFPMYPYHVVLDLCACSCSE